MDSQEKDSDDGDLLARDCGFVLLSDLRPIIPLSKCAIRRMWQQDKFPKPIKIGGRLAFRKRDIAAWAEAQ